LEDVGAFLLQRWSDIGLTIFTGVLTVVAVLTLLGSIQGPKIVLLLDDLIEVPTKPLSRTKPPDQEFHELMSLELPVVFSNTGPRGGAIRDIDIVMVEPPSIIPTTKYGNSYDTVELKGRMGEVPYQPKYFFGRHNVLTIRNAESVGLVAQLEIYLREKDKDTRAPSNTLLEIQQKYPYFKFKMRYLTTSGEKFVQHEREFSIRPKFIP